MSEKEQNILNELTLMIKKKFSNESTGHDFYHIERVLKISQYISKHEGADLLITSLGALLHDIDDHKFNGGDWEANKRSASKILEKYALSNNIKDQVLHIIENCSYKGSHVDNKMQSIEGKCVQDADRLDALGAIGIARTFAYGGKKGHPIYNPEIKPSEHHSKEDYFQGESHTINHFYEKLLLLKDRMNTTTGKKLAEERHAFMEQFLNQFYNEWKGY